MAGISPILARTTSLLRSDQLLSRMQRTQHELHDVQRQISTGKRYNVPSDAPEKAGAMLLLQQRLVERQQYAVNLEHSRGILNNIDSALGEANDLLIQARTVAMSQIGVGSDAETREAEALVVDEQLRAMIELGNSRYNQIALFGGNRGGPSDEPVFETFLGGVRYRGTEQNLRSDSGEWEDQVFTSNGIEAFGALSARVVSQTDLDPQLSANTRLAELNGAQDQGIRRGSVQLTVDGMDVTVDLAEADTLGDVVTRINEAITNIDATAGSLSVAASGGGLDLTANAGHTITIADPGSGQTAADLGIELTASGATVAGGDLDRRLSETTQLSELGASVDFASGLHIEQGDQVKVADFSSAQTIQDLQNVIDELNLGLRLEINGAGSALNLVSEVSGIELAIGENGGTTAADLGLRTLGAQTQLADFRHGLGVENQQGADDFAITLHDGTSFQVNIDGVNTVGDLITTIESAAAAAGLTLGTDFEVGMAGTGNGLAFTDNTAGAESFRIENVGQSLAGNHLGITASAGAGTTITSTDRAKVKVDSAFSHLIDLRDALRNNNESGITLAGSEVEEDLDRLSQAHARVGVQARRAEDQQHRLQDRELAEKAMLSNLQDAELTEVITRFGQLQQQLQASLQTAAQNMQMSLLDFLR